MWGTAYPPFNSPQLGISLLNLQLGVFAQPLEKVQ